MNLYYVRTYESCEWWLLNLNDLSWVVKKFEIACDFMDYRVCMGLSMLAICSSRWVSYLISYKLVGSVSWQEQGLADYCSYVYLKQKGFVLQG
jgi:hypothetical protein